MEISNKIDFQGLVNSEYTINEVIKNPTNKISHLRKLINEGK